MFKLKPGNVFQKINTMNRKQAYTWGAVVVVLIVALSLLSSLMGNAEDKSFDGLDARGYDLAQMPFMNDEAEQYLLASKYPDMQGKDVGVLYTSQQKADRQEQDAQKAEAQDSESNNEGFDSRKRNDWSEASTSRAYRGRSYGGGGGNSSPTSVGKLGNANMGHASGSGIGGTWGGSTAKGDFSPYKSQDKGKEAPVQFKNQDARKALYQFARGSQAAAGLKEGKGGNAKRALMGGNIAGSEAFGDGGVDLSKANGLAIDTEAPATPDLSNLDDALKDATQQSQKDDDSDDDDEEEDDDWGQKLLEQFLAGMIDVAVDGCKQLLGGAIDKLYGKDTDGVKMSDEEKATFDKCQKTYSKDTCLGFHYWSKTSGDTKTGKGSSDYSGGGGSFDGKLGDDYYVS